MDLHLWSNIQSGSQLAEMVASPFRNAYPSHIFLEVISRTHIICMMVLSILVDRCGASGNFGPRRLPLAGVTNHVDALLRLNESSRGPRYPPLRFAISGRHLCPSKRRHRDGKSIIVSTSWLPVAGL